MTDSTEATTAAPQMTEAERAARRRRSLTGEAERGLWRRVGFRRAIAEGALIFVAWRLLELIPIAIWPAALFPVVLLGLLLLRFLPPVWAASRVIATRREKMSRRFFSMAGILAAVCALADTLIALLIGEARQPFGGPLAGPDLPRLFATGSHHLDIGAFLVGELLTLGLLLGYYLIATICARLAHGGFLRFTMPGGDGRVTL